MRRKLAFSLALSLGLVLPACKKELKPDLKIGLIAELSGDIAKVGASAKKAAELAVLEINEKGGVTVAGEKHGVLLVVEDSASKADVAVEAAKKLINEENVYAVVGPNSSTGAVPASDVAEAAKVVMISPWSTAPKTTLSGAGPKKYVYRACFTDPFEGHVLAKFGLDYVRAKKAAVLYDAGSEAPRSQAELFKKDFESAGGQVVAFETYATGDKDFSAQLGKIKAAGPDLLFLPSYYNDVPAQLEQAKAAGLTVPVLGSDNWSTEDIEKTLGPNAEGAFVCAHYHSEAKNTITGTFVNSYKKAHGGHTPDDVAALTYDSVNLLLKAISGASALNREAIRESLAKITEYEGVTGKMLFKGSGDPIKPAAMMQIKSGKLMFVTYVDP